jgi:uncharacterized protein YuzE
VEKILVVFTKETNTMDIWFDKPEKEFVCEETGEEIILKKDKKGKIVGIELLNVLPSNKKQIKEPVKLILK